MLESQSIIVIPGLRVEFLLKVFSANSPFFVSQYLVAWSVHIHWGEKTFLTDEKAIKTFNNWQKADQFRKISTINLKIMLVLKKSIYCLAVIKLNDGYGTVLSSILVCFL